MINFGDIVTVSIPNEKQTKGIVCGFMKYAVDKVALVFVDGSYMPVYSHNFLSPCGFHKEFADQCFDEYIKESITHYEIVKEVPSDKWKEQTCQEILDDINCLSEVFKKQ